MARKIAFRTARTATALWSRLGQDTVVDVLGGVWLVTMMLALLNLPAMLG